METGGCLRLQSNQSAESSEAGQSESLESQGERMCDTTLEGRIYHAPVLRQNTLYALTTETTLHAVSLDGEQLWAASPSGADKTESGPTLVSDGICFGDTDGNIYKFDFEGNQQWQYESNNSISRPPAGDQDSVYVTAESNEVVSLNATNGNARWRLTRPASGFVLSTPEIGDTRIYVGGFDKFRAIDKATGDIAWEYESLDPIKPVPTYSSDGVYTGSDGNRVFAFNPTDGSELWSASVSAAVWTSPVITDSRVVVGTNDGKVFGLNREDGSEVWQHPAESPVQPDPAIVDDTVYVLSNDGKLIVMDATEGSIQWQHASNENFEAAPQPTPDGNILLSSFEWKVQLIAPP